MSSTPAKKTREANRYKVRWLTLSDLADVYSLSKSSGGEDFWEYEHFQDAVRADPPVCLVACDPDTNRPVAFCCYGIGERAHRVLNLVVGKEYRGKGIGVRLLSTLEKLQGVLQRESLSAFVRESDLPFQLYLKRRGFRCVGIDADAFLDPPEDAYVFIRPVITLK